MTGFLIGLGVRFGIRTAWLSGIGAGIVGAVLAVFATTTRPEMAQFVAVAFLLLIAVMITRFFLIIRGVARNPDFRQALASSGGAALAAATSWIIALGIGMVGYMIPVLIIPLVFGKGALIGPLDVWYRDVFALILAWPLPLTALLTLAGFTLIVFAERQTR